MRPKASRKLSGNGRNEGENDRMNANNFYFLHCITTYVRQRVASNDLVPQKDPGADQRCVLSKEKIERK